MAVTELALLPTLSNDNAEVPSAGLLSALKRAKELLETSSGHAFNFFQQVEDPTLIYVLGGWPSTAAHEAFLSSPTLSDLFRGHMDIERALMYHLELEPTPSSFPLDAPVISVNRHFIKPGQRGAFGARFGEVKPLLEGYTRPRPVAAGWRIEKEAEDKDEWVVFSGFDSVEQHMGFAKTVEFQKYQGIREFVDGFGLRHMKRLEGV